ncbi:MAG: MFS transporter [Pseudomonadota bacterium]
MNRANNRQLYARPVRHLFVFVLSVLLLSQLAISTYAWSLTESQFLPELERKAHTVGASVSRKLARALDYGIPPEKLEGVPDFFNDILKDNPDLAYLALARSDGTVMYRGGASADSALFMDTATPVLLHGATAAQLHVGVDRRFIASRVRELRYDIGIVLLTSLLIAFEILWFVVTLNFSAPMRQLVELMTCMAGGDFRHRALSAAGESLAATLNRIEARINQGYNEVVKLAVDPMRKAIAEPMLQGLRDAYRFAEGGHAHDLVQQRVVVVRILSFLFMFAEMLSRSFLPLYAGSLPSPVAGLSDGLLASIPVTAFLLGVALSMPFAGRWSDQIGRRRSYVAGALFVAGGLACAGLVPEYLVLVLARAMTGVGYALMFMSCQGYVLDNTTSRNSGKGMAMFVGAIMVAEICAPAVGGILADRIGYRMVFVVGACVAALAALLAVRVLDNASARAARDGAPRLPLRWSVLVRNRRFLTLSILSGIPAKFLYSGFLIFLVPMLLSNLGNTKSEIGRYTMLYGLIALALAPVFARLADRYNAYALMVGLGGALTGLGLLPVLRGADTNVVMLGIAALGLGQSMSISAQLVLVARVTREETRGTGTSPVLGVFRLLERLGAAAGPLVTGALVAAFGAAKAMLALGVFAVLASLLFGAAFLALGSGESEVTA